MWHGSPYFGQSSWFQNFHSEKVPSSVERFDNEIKRDIGVLDGVPAKQKYLVGDKVTTADLSFVPWNAGALSRLVPDVQVEKDYPALAR